MNREIIFKVEVFLKIFRCVGFIDWIVLNVGLSLFEFIIVMIGIRIRVIIIMIFCMKFV